MASEHNLTNHRPWWHISKRLARNPFDPQFPIAQLEYCKSCEMDVDTQVEAGNAGGVDVYRKRCKRCGEVMQHGIGMRNVASDAITKLPKEALDFIKQRGPDRR